MSKLSLSLSLCVALGVLMIGSTCPILVRNPTEREGETWRIIRLIFCTSNQLFNESSMKRGKVSSNLPPTPPPPPPPKNNIPRRCNQSPRYTHVRRIRCSIPLGSHIHRYWWPHSRTCRSKLDSTSRGCTWSNLREIRRYGSMLAEFTLDNDVAKLCGRLVSYFRQISIYVTIGSHG